MRVTVVDYGRSNLLSVCRALAALGAQPQLAQTPEQVRRAGALVLPGVGAFAGGMAALCESGLAAPLVEKARPSRCRILAGARCSPRAGAKIFPARPLRA